MMELFWRLYSRMLARGVEPGLRGGAVLPLIRGLEKLERSLSRPPGRGFPVAGRPRPWSGPLVSVIITCYNYGRYLDRVLGALASQTWRNFETILVDDGSDDPATVTMVTELEKRQQPGFKVIRQENQGVIAARQRGVAVARGKYIFPLDADDTIEKTFLEKCLFFLEHTLGNTFVYTWTRTTGRDGFIWPTRDCPPGPVLNENRMGYAVFSRSAYNLVGGYNPVMAGGYEDWELCVNLVAHGFCGRVIREPLYNYLVKPGARNFHANRQHEELRRRIAELHRTAIASRWSILCGQARSSGYRDEALENLLFPAPAGAGEEEKAWLLDLSRSPRGKVTAELLAEICSRSAAITGRVLLLLDHPRPEIFLGPVPENLFIYSPAEYHPGQRSEPFSRYLELRYRPEPLNLNEISALQVVSGTKNRKNQQQKMS